MGLYNALFGKNPNSEVLKSILNLDQENGKWRTGRFRDIYVEKGKDGKNYIILYTRNGGGNRDHWDFSYAEHKEGENCPCAGCTIMYHLPKHPNYINDWDDDFDSTYAYIKFSIPEIYKLMEDITKKPNQKWNELFDNLKKKKINDPEVQNALKIGEKIFKLIKEGKSKITIGEDKVNGTVNK